jgi:hypothetical protein
MDEAKIAFNCDSEVYLSPRWIAKRLMYMACSSGVWFEDRNMHFSVIREKGEVKCLGLYTEDTEYFIGLNELGNREGVELGDGWIGLEGVASPDPGLGLKMMKGVARYAASKNKGILTEPADPRLRKIYLSNGFRPFRVPNDKWQVSALEMTPEDAKAFADRKSISDDEFLAAVDELEIGGAIFASLAVKHPEWDGTYAKRALGEGGGVDNSCPPGPRGSKDSSGGGEEK